MTLIYKNSPLALKPLMDKAFSEDQNDTQEGEDGINTDFGWAKYKELCHFHAIVICI